MPHIPEEILEAIAQKLVSRPRHSDFQLTSATDLTQGRNSNPPPNIEDLVNAYNISVKALAHLTEASKQFRRLAIPFLYFHINFPALSDERLLLLIEVLEHSISQDTSDGSSSNSNSSPSPSAAATRANFGRIAAFSLGEQTASQQTNSSYGHFIQTIDLGPPRYPIPARRHILYGRLMNYTPNLLGLAINTYTDTYHHFPSYPPVQSSPAAELAGITPIPTGPDGWLTPPTLQQPILKKLLHMHVSSSFMNSAEYLIGMIRFGLFENLQKLELRAQFDEEAYGLHRSKDKFEIRRPIHDSREQNPQYFLALPNLRELVIHLRNPWTAYTMKFLSTPTIETVKLVLYPEEIKTLWVQEELLFRGVPSAILLKCFEQGYLRRSASTIKKLTIETRFPSPDFSKARTHEPVMDEQELELPIKYLLALENLVYDPFVFPNWPAMSYAKEVEAAYCDPRRPELVTNELNKLRNIGWIIPYDWPKTFDEGTSTPNYRQANAPKWQTDVLKNHQTKILSHALRSLRRVELLTVPMQGGTDPSYRVHSDAFNCSHNSTRIGGLELISWWRSFVGNWNGRIVSVRNIA